MAETWGIDNPISAEPETVLKMAWCSRKYHKFRGYRECFLEMFKTTEVPPLTSKGPPPSLLIPKFLFLTENCLREGVNGKKRFLSFEFFGPLFRSAFFVNKKSLFLQKCQCIEPLNLEFWRPKKGPSCPNWGQGGGWGWLGDSGNARRTRFFFIEAFP